MGPTSKRLEFMALLREVEQSFNELRYDQKLEGEQKRQ